MSTEALGFGYGGVSRFSGNRGRMGDGMNRPGVRYPNPFFDIGHTYLPPSMKHMLHWCRYYYLVNPLINTVIHKMSEYPVTELVIDESNEKLKQKWDQVLNKTLRYRAFQIEAGLDYYTYGMCVVTIHFPFTKYLCCKSCDRRHKATKTFYRWRNYEYVFTCKKCGHTGPAKVLDWYERDVNRIRLIRWNPEYLKVEPGFGGADPIYIFELPPVIKSELILGKKLVLDTVPDIFVESLKRNKNIRFADDNVFVLKRPVISQKDNGWGMPLIMPVLKDSYYLQILRKAQEQIAQEHIIPLRILFPQASGTGATNPYENVSVDSWQRRIEGEVSKWKYDNNYIPVMPLPVGYETLGGDGKSLGLYQEMDVWSRQIVAGMGVPEEFVFGGLTYSGSNVSMRMLENMFIGYRTDHENMLNNFVIRRIANFMQWPTVKAYMKRFKMADDLQRAAFLFQANQAQKISDQTFLQEIDQDPALEDARKKGELDRLIEYQRKMQLAQAHIQGEMMVIQAKYQAQAQKLMMENMPQGMPQDGAGAGAEEGAGGPMDPMEGAPDGMGMGGPQSGQEGEMVEGKDLHPSMPDGMTVSPENAQQAPNEGVPMTAQSPLTMGLKGGGMNLLSLARRAYTAIEKKDAMTRTTDLNQLKMGQPQIYSLVMQMMMKDRGSQANPLDPLQSPLPTQKPTRRAAPVG